MVLVYDEIRHDIAQRFSSVVVGVEIFVLIVGRISNEERGLATEFPIPPVSYGAMSGNSFRKGIFIEFERSRTRNNQFSCSGRSIWTFESERESFVLRRSIFRIPFQ